MTRPVAEIEQDLAVRRKHADTISRLQAEGLTPEQRQVEEELLAALNDELAALAEKSAPPAAEPVVKNLATVSPVKAAQRAAAIAADPRFWDPRKANEKGERLTSAEHARLVAERSELLGRAAEGVVPGIEKIDRTAAAEKAIAIGERLVAGGGTAEERDLLLRQRTEYLERAAEE